MLKLKKIRNARQMRYYVVQKRILAMSVKDALAKEKYSPVDMVAPLEENPPQNKEIGFHSH